MRAPPPEIEAYLDAIPPGHRAALERVRESVLAAVPEASEKISLKMPAFALEGRPFLWMGAFAKHCSLFPGTIRFPPDAPPTAAFVKKLAREKARAAASRKRLG